MEALKAALIGRSTKGKERGFGISSSVKMFVEGLNGEFMIVSDAVAIYITTSDKIGFNLRKEHRLAGTLVSMKVPYPSQIIPNDMFYRYVEDR